MAQPEQPSDPDIVEKTSVSAVSKQPRNRTALFVVGLLLLASLVVAITVLNNDEASKKSEETTENAQAAVVEIIDSGFSPETISILVGQTVTWRNIGDAEHRVAADPYPIHDSLPGLDSQEALSTNDSFSFTFEEAGTYRYHDHLNPEKIRGSVIVEEKQ